MNSDKQKTIKEEIQFEGVGLHTGESSILRILPAPEDFGYKFKRVDIEGSPIVEARLENVIDTSRGTTIAQNGVEIHTIEHILAALYGLGIDNALLELNGKEVPILDGSSGIFVEALLNTGYNEQNKEKDYFVLKENISYEDTEKQAEMLAVPQDEFRITVMVDYKSPLLGTQHATMYHLGEFQNEIAPCRTFVFLREIEELAKQNLIKGGDLDNAIVMVDQPVSQKKLDYLAELLQKPKVKVNNIGIGTLNNVKLHFENEPARHKLLDIIGDFALLGFPIKAHILAARPGHKSNVEFAKEFKKKRKEYMKNSKIPTISPEQKPVYDINEISKILPHRQPFLLIDKIMEIGNDYVIGVKNVTINEYFFKGHFPGEPVMPGVLQIEAMAQTGGILALKEYPDPENYTTYFMKIDKVKFKHKVVPGDTLVFYLKLLSPIRRGICHMKGTAYVGRKIVMEGEMMAKIVRKEGI